MRNDMVVGILASVALMACGAFIHVVLVSEGEVGREIPHLVFWVSGAIAVALASCAVLVNISNRASARDKVHSELQNRLYWEQKEIRDKQAELARIERLKADPATRVYGERIEAGDYFSDSEIAYAIDPAWLVTCEHLQPIEKAMRQAGIRAYSIDGRSLYVRCVVDETRLAQQFTLRPPAYYEPDFGSNSRDPAMARFLCREHHSVINVVHRDGAYRTTPFPLPDLPM